MKTNPQIVFRKEFDGTALLFNPETGETFGLNQTSAFIWEKLAEGLNETELFSALQSACSGELPTGAADDVKSFIASLQEKSFLSE